MPLSREDLRDRNRRLRKGVELHAGRTLTDVGWQTFLDKEVSDDEPYRDELVEELVEMLGGYLAVAKRPTSRPPSRSISTGPTDEARAAYEEALSWFATRRMPVSVAHFRRGVLGGRLLAGRKVRPWLNTLLREEGEERGLRDEYRELVSLTMDTILPVFEIPVIELRDPANSKSYWAPVERGSSDVDRLRRISENLAGNLGWTRGDATLWVIAGRQPAMPMIRTVFHPSTPLNAFGERFEMTIDPAATPHDVMSAFAEARSQVVGRKLRTQSPKHLRLAIFADDRPQDDTWEASMRRWNREHPNWTYERVTNFARDAVQARQRFLEARPFASGEE